MALNLFLSYGRKDGKTFAMQLFQDLTSAGYRVWLDLDEIAMGGDFTQEIERAIDTCDVMLALISPSSLASGWCRAEQLRAIRKGKRVIPLMITPDVELPLALEHLNYIDFSTPERYAPMLRDLLSDLASGQAFRPLQSEANSAFQVAKLPRTPRTAPTIERRNASAFRRHLRHLRNQDWGGRSWWTYFVFAELDIHEAVHALDRNALESPFLRRGKRTSQWDRWVRLSFRPRNPHAFHMEGFRYAHEQKPDNYAPMPVYFLFDLEALLLHPKSRFSDGNVAEGASLFATPQAFSELPFEQIYHDGWIKTSEREETMRHRRAELLLPDSVGLESLQLIWTRSEAEYETLHQLLNAKNPFLWRKWHDKITPRNDYILFNHNRPHLMNAWLSEKSVRLRFNVLQEIQGTFLAQAMVRYEDGTEWTWQNDALDPRHDVHIEHPRTGSYTLSFLIDGDLAYEGAYEGAVVVL